MRTLVLVLLSLVLVTPALGQRGEHQNGGEQMYHSGGGDHWHGNNHGWHSGGYYNHGPDLGTAIIGGAIGTMFGNWFSRPEVVVVPAPAPVDRSFCWRRFHSYDGQTYLGYDGYRHTCP